MLSLYRAVLVLLLLEDQGVGTPARYKGLTLVCFTSVLWERRGLWQQKNDLQLVLAMQNVPERWFWIQAL